MPCWPAWERSCDLPSLGHVFMPVCTFRRLSSAGSRGARLCVPSEDYPRLVLEEQGCNPLLRRLRQEDPKIEASLGYTVGDGNTENTQMLPDLAEPNLKVQNT